MDLTPNGNETLDFEPTNLPREHLAAIGLLSAAASHTDSILEMAIAGMLGLDGEQGWAVTAHMTAPQRINALKSAAEIALQDERALNELDSLLSRLETAMKARNEMVHGSWCYRKSDRTVLLVKQEARTHVNVTSRPVSADEITVKANEIYHVGINLMRFLIAVDRVPELPSDRVRGINTPKARKARIKKNEQ